MSRGPTRRKVAATYTVLTLFTAATLYPVMLVLKKAFEPGRDFALSPSPIPSELTLSNFTELLGTRGSGGELLFARYALNSAIVAIATTIVGVFLACTAAYALSRHRFKGRKTSLGMFLVVQMFPSVLLMMPLYVVALAICPLISLASTSEQPRNFFNCSCTSFSTSAMNLVP